MRSFIQYISENTSEMVFSFGRFNPPTIGHEKLIEKAAANAKGNNFRIYASQSQDAKKNPLSYDDKIKFMRKMFPRYGRNIIHDSSIRTVFDILVGLYKEGYSKVSMVVGSDRVKEFEVLANKYNGQDARHGFYNFEDGINIISAGERDPDKDTVSGMSASKMREAAADEDFGSFMKGMPSNFSGARDLFNAIRKGMGLAESYDFRNKIKFEPVSADREAYISGDLFENGDIVRDNKTLERCSIVRCGSNYVVLEHDSGKTSRKWIKDITLVDTII
jgi:phosphopantetheine adenylyltransferase